MGLVNLSFPDSLSEYEEKLIIQQIMNGYDYARNIIAERNQRLVLHIAKRFAGDDWEILEEYFAIGCVGLVAGAKSYDPQKNDKLAGYLGVCIENEILKHLKYERRRKGYCYLDEPVSVDEEGREMTLLDTIGVYDYNVQYIDKIETLTCLRKAINMLNSEEKKIISLYYFSRMTQENLAKYLGKNRNSIRFKIKNALKKMRKELVHFN